MVTLQQPGYDIIAQFMIGYLLPGKPIANLLFKIYGRISTVHALSFLQDLKLGHYMKIPPRCMYTAQVFLAQNLLVETLFLSFFFSCLLMIIYFDLHIAGGNTSCWSGEPFSGLVDVG